MKTATPVIPEKPILFSGPMVRAILDGRKTQTRRVVTWRRQSSGLPQSHLHDFDRAWVDHGFPDEMGEYHNAYLHVPFAHPEDGWAADPKDDAQTRVYCPYGSAGTRLWVRETWMPLWDSGAGFYTCLCPTGHQDKPDICKCRADGEKPENFGANWRSSIHMPRRASRITLEIADVRVERLNEISEGDAAAEGVGRIELQPAPLLGEHNGRKMYGHPMTSTHEHAFRVLWESINGAGSWEANPWVWVLEFKKC